MSKKRRDRRHPQFRLDGELVDFKTAPLDEIQATFSHRFCELWESGELRGPGVWIDTALGESDLSKKPVAEKHRRRAVLALSLVLARSPAAIAFFVLANHTHTPDHRDIIDLILFLLQGAPLAGRRGDLFLRFVVMSEWTRRAIGELLLATTGDYPPEWLPQSGKRRISTTVLNLFKPAQNPDMAVALLWANPEARVCEAATREAAYKAFSAAWTRLPDAKNGEAPSYGQFYQAAARLGLWGPKAKQGRHKAQ